MDLPLLLSENASAFLQISSYNFRRASFLIRVDMSNSLESQLEHLMQEEYPHMAGGRLLHFVQRDASEVQIC